MNMPKSRDIHAKIPLPEAILLNFGIVSVKILNRYYDKIRLQEIILVIGQAGGKGGRYTNH